MDSLVKIHLAMVGIIIEQWVPMHLLKRQEDQEETIILFLKDVIRVEVVECLVKNVILVTYMILVNQVVRQQLRIHNLNLQHIIIHNIITLEMVWEEFRISMLALLVVVAVCRIIMELEEDLLDRICKSMLEGEKLGNYTG